MSRIAKTHSAGFKALQAISAAATTAVSSPAFLGASESASAVAATVVASTASAVATAATTIANVATVVANSAAPQEHVDVST